MAKALKDIRNQMKKLVEDVNKEDKSKYVISFTNPLFSPYKGYVESISIWNDQSGDYVRGTAAIIYLLYDKPNHDDIVIKDTISVEKAYVIPLSKKDLAEKAVAKLNSYCEDNAWAYSSHKYKLEQID